LARESAIQGKFGYFWAMSITIGGNPETADEVERLVLNINYIAT